MKITFEQSELLNALHLVNGACGDLNTLPILSCVFIESESGAVTIIGNNLEIAIEVKTPAVIETEGTIAVPAKRLLSLVKELPKDVPIVFEGKKDKAVITCGGDTYNMNGMDADDYPMQAEIEGETFTMSCRELQSILQRTEFAASKDAVKYTLNSVFFNEREIVATDGTTYLARVVSPIQTPKFLLPLMAVKELLKSFKDLESDVSVVISKSVVSFIGDDVRLTTRLIEGDYPPYQKIMPDKSSYPTLFAPIF